MNKVATRSKMNSNAYNQNASSKYGNNKFAFKEAPKASSNSVKINTEIKENTNEN